MWVINRKTNKAVEDRSIIQQPCLFCESSLFYRANDFTAHCAVEHRSVSIMLKVKFFIVLYFGLWFGRAMTLPIWFGSKKVDFF